MQTLKRVLSHPIQSENSKTSFNRRWTIGFALFVVFITSIPYLIGYGKQGEAWRFTGFVFGVEDGNSYIAKMLSGAEGNWLFRTPYTVSPQQGMLAYLPYLLLGKLTAPPGEHDQLVALYHLFRCLAVMFAILASSDFLGLFLNDIRMRRLALVLVNLGGGLGWVVVWMGHSTWSGSLPLEFYSPESFGFLSLFGLPHLACARALLLWGLTYYLGNSRGRRAGQWRIGNPILILPPGLVTGFLWLLLGFAQPLTVVIGWMLVITHLGGLGVWLVWLSRKGKQPDWMRWVHYAKKGLVAVGLSAPLVIYSVVAFRVDPFLRTWLTQNVILSPDPIYYLLAYGILLPMVLIGGFQILRMEPWTGCLVVGWVLLLPFLAYAPINMQRRLPEGIWVALVILTCRGLSRIQEEIAQGTKWGRQGSWKKLLSKLIYIPLFTVFPSTLILLVGGVTSIIKPSEPIFRTTAQVSAFQFLAEQARPDAVVFTGYETGNAVPAWAPVKVVVGHGPESVDLANLLPKVKETFQGDFPDLERKAFLKGMGVDYVFWGPAEMRLGGWNPSSAPYLEIVYQKNGYTIFRMGD